MGTVELFGILLIILGVAGMIVMLKGKPPEYTSQTEPTKQ